MFLSLLYAKYSPESVLEKPVPKHLYLNCAESLYYLIHN